MKGTLDELQSSLPEEGPTCECKYDSVLDRMDREEWPFHCDTADDSAADEVRADASSSVKSGEPSPAIELSKV